MADLKQIRVTPIRNGKLGKYTDVMAPGNITAIRELLDKQLKIGEAFKIEACLSMEANTNANNAMYYMCQRMGERTEYFKVTINKSEKYGYSAGALHQNWFCADSMKMIYEYYDTQLFFSTDTRCLYIVTQHEDDSINIREISPECSSYEATIIEYMSKL